jgi:hypothetical protein
MQNLTRQPAQLSGNSFNLHKIAGHGCQNCTIPSTHAPHPGPTPADGPQRANNRLLHKDHQQAWQCCKWQHLSSNQGSNRASTPAHHTSTAVQHWSKESSSQSNQSASWMYEAAIINLLHPSCICQGAGTHRQHTQFLIHVGRGVSQNSTHSQHLARHAIDIPASLGAVCLMTDES